MAHSKTIYIKLSLTLLVISSLLMNTTYSSLQKVTFEFNGVRLENPCNVSFLSSYYPLPDKPRTAVPSDKETQMICPNLKFTCCNKKMMDKFSQNAYNFKTFYSRRKDIILEMLELLSQFSFEDFKDFLTTVQDNDIQCYNDIQKERVDLFLSQLPEEQSSLLNREKLLSDRLYNVHDMKKSFARIHKELKTYMNGFEEMFKTNVHFMTSVVCSMCSPNFYKIYDTFKNPPVLYVNEDLCMNVIKNKVYHSNLHQVYRYIKHIVFLSHCMKKNSRKHVNFGDFDWKKVEIVSIKDENQEQAIEDLTSCYSRPDAFDDDSKIKDYCMKECSKNLTFPYMMKTRIKNFIRAKTELYNMFLRHSNSQDPDSYLKDIYQENSDFNKYYEDNNTVEFPEDSRKIIIYVTKPIKEDYISFPKIELRIRQIYSLDYQTTNMKLENLKNINRIMMFIVTVFLTLLI